MILTPSAIEAMEFERWSPDPETAATLKFIITTLTTPEIDGISMLERVYLTCPHENQRCDQVEAAGFAFLKKRFKDASVFFKADCPEDGRCRFELRIADSIRDLQSEKPAKAEYFINLLKPHDEWIRPPKTELLLKTPAKSATKPSPAQPVKPAQAPPAGKAVPARRK